MIVAWLGFRFRPNPNLQDSRYIIVAGDMNDYDARLADSFGHTPKSMALELMTQPEGEASRLISVGQHVKSADRFTDWCGCQICLLLPNTSALSVHRYDIDGDCVDDGGKEHSAIGKRLGALNVRSSLLYFCLPSYECKQTMCSYRKSSTKRCLELRIGMTSNLQSSAIAPRD